MALLDDDSAKELFSRMKLAAKDLEALDQTLMQHGEEPRHAKGPAVMSADPEGEGVLPLRRFLEVVRARREQLEKARREREITEAYIALGGSEDREKRVASEALVAIASDFVGEEAAAAALQAVVKHKMGAVQELLDMGGELEEEEAVELQDTRRLGFEEVKAFGEGLRAFGPIAVATEPSLDEVLR